MIEDEFTKLYKYMDRKFKAIDDRFDQTATKAELKAVNKRLDQMATKAELKAGLDQVATKAELNNHIKTTDKQFMKLFKYLDGKFKASDDRLDRTDAKINIYVNAVDAFAKQSETYMQEMLALSHQVDRHERWHYQTAKAAGIKLQA
jgi:CII-binding regulator of phage lambda lysogenization HflD